MDGQAPEAMMTGCGGENGIKQAMLLLVDDLPSRYGYRLVLEMWRVWSAVETLA